MKSPESNKITIRLEMNVPAGAATVTGLTAARNFDDTSGGFRRFVRPQPPNAGRWSVLPDSTGFGTICGQVEFDNPMYKVVAAVYPAQFFPTLGPTDPPPSWQQTGTKLAYGRVWKWDRSNAVPMAAHSSAGPDNRLAIWVQETNTSALEYDGSTAFFGVTNTVPCGGSISASHTIDVELACAAVLQVVVPDGPNTGHYPATRVASRAWTATIGEATYSITLTPEYTLSIRGGSKAAASKSIAEVPFLATFPGQLFGSNGDVLVMVA